MSGAGLSTRERLTLAAAFAVALGSAAVVPLYADHHWILRALGAIGIVAVTGFACRRAHVPALLQPLATTAALGIYVCLVFARSTLALGLVPTSDTRALLWKLLQAGGRDIDRLAPPVPSTTGLVLIAVLGVGAVAVAVDLVAVVLGRAGAAGMPLLILFAVPSAVLPSGLGWLPFVFVATGWLSLLLVEGGDRVSRWGTPLQAQHTSEARYDDASLGRVGRRIGAAALGIAVIVPALVPGLNNRLIGAGKGDGAGNGSHVTTTYNPITKLRDDLRLSKPRDVLTYSTSADSPDYLRMTTLDLFSDAGWSSSKLTGSRSSAGVKGATLPWPVALNPDDSTTVKVDIRIRNLDAQWLPVPAVPSKVSVDGTWLYDDRSETVFTTRSGTRKLKKSYSVTSVVATPTRDSLEAPPTDVPPDSILSYALNPGDQVTDAVRRLTDDIVRGKRTPYDRVAAIQAFFTAPSSGFLYSESSRVPGITSPSALEAFLRARQGFCEQYASAMAAMIRLAGVPARVAVGFTAGTRQKDGTYRVTTHDAHAWPEAWFAGTGWVRFEPTPRRDGQTSVPGYAQPVAPGAPGGQTLGGSALPTPSPTANASKGKSALDKFDQLEAQQGAKAKAKAAARRGHVLALLLVGVAMVLLALLVPRLLHVVRRRRRWQVGGPLAGWQQVREDAVDVGHQWRPADSPRTAAAGLASRHAFDARAREALGRLATAAERARYARTAPVDVARVDGPRMNGARMNGAGGDGTGLYDDAALVRTALRSAVDRRTRWQAWLLPRSTLRWAASGLGTAVADGLDAVDEGLARIRRLRPRGLRPT